MSGRTCAVCQSSPGKLTRGPRGGPGLPHPAAPTAAHSPAADPAAAPTGGSRASALTAQRKGCVGGTRLGSGCWGVHDHPDKRHECHPQDRAGARVRDGGWLDGGPPPPSQQLSGGWFTAWRPVNSHEGGGHVQPLTTGQASTCGLALREADREGRGRGRGQGRGRRAGGREREPGT